MLLALLLSIFALCLYRIRFNLKGFNEDYLSKDSTNSIKGIFILLIVISHSLHYIRRSSYAFEGIGDSWFLLFFFYLSQLVVVMFLFYSGYGVGESYKSKGMDYVKSMPRHRILGTLLNFDVAVIVFIVFNLLLGISITFRQSALSLIGWGDVGNDNWYIFVILLLYIATYLTLRLPLSRQFHRVSLLFVLSIVCLIVLSIFKENYWYNTILCYPLGFMYSAYKERIETQLKSNYCFYALIISIAFVLVFKCLMGRYGISYNAISLLFALLIIILTCKVSINNSPLCWVGKHLFPIYIYMRLPMIFMEEKTPALVGTYPAVFVLIALAVTLLIARCYKYWEIRL